MSAPLSLLIYGSLMVLASLAGGWVPLVVRLSHRWMQVAISFVAGVMLGIGLLHLLPHAAEELDSVDTAVVWTMVGFLAMFFLERFFQFHHHELPEGGEVGSTDVHVDSCADHSHDHHHADVHGSANHSQQMTWFGAAIGLTLHSLIDGIALAAAVMAESHGEHPPLWAGLGTFLAIALHKPLDSLSIGTLMAAGGWTVSFRQLVNVAYALVLPCGVLLFWAGAAHFDGREHAFLGRALGFAAGTFLCIATSDLLPELQFHRHDRAKLSLALILGIVLAWGLVYVETSGHSH